MMRRRQGGQDSLQSKSTSSMTSLRLLTLLVCVVAACLSACVGDTDERSSYVSIDTEGWAFGDAKTFTLGIADSADSVPATGQMAVVVRHDNSYEYSNIWLQLTYETGDTVVVDTINMPLADAYGKWLGNGIGVSFQRMLPLDGDVTIDLTKPVALAHIMRADTLPHIQQVGVVFTPHQVPHASSVDDK